MQLNQQQIKAVRHSTSPLLVLAGAGSGKTRVVIERIYNLIKNGVSSQSILVVTFSNKAAKEIVARLDARLEKPFMGFAGTFHSWGAQFLRSYGSVIGIAPQFNIYDKEETKKLLQMLVKRLNIQVDIKKLHNAISLKKNRVVEDFPIASFLQLYESYESELRLAHALDFDDLLLLPLKILQQERQLLADQRLRWQHLIVDEYQDVNQVQAALVSLLAQDSFCAVGDPDQSIYAWRGAHIDSIINFQKQFPQSVVIPLEENYRSTQTILTAANGVIEHNRSRIEKNLWSHLVGPPVYYKMAFTDRDESEFIVRTIDHLHYEDGVPLEKIAILYRSNAQSRALEEMLVTFQIPYHVVGGVGFYQRKEIKDAIAWLRLMLSDCDTIAFVRALEAPKVGIGATSIQKILLQAKQMQGNILTAGAAVLRGKQRAAFYNWCERLRLARSFVEEHVGPWIEAVLEHVGYLEYVKNLEDAATRLENIQALFSKAAEVQNEKKAFIHFLEEVSLASQTDTLGYRDKVQLMTLHNAKGLEFDAVFLAGLEETLLPHANAIMEDPSVEEERRLMYVGMTRARRLLYLTSAQWRFLWGGRKPMRPSRFLEEIPQKTMELL